MKNMLKSQRQSQNFFMRSREIAQPINQQIIKRIAGGSQSERSNNEQRENPGIKKEFQNRPEPMGLHFLPP